MDSTGRLRDDFFRDGYVVLPDVVPRAACEAALRKADSIFYGGPYEDWLRAFDAGTRAGPVPDGVAPLPNGRRTHFPVGDAAIDRLIENERILDATAEILADEPFFCSAHLFSRTGPVDERFSQDPDGGWHFDHFNHGLLPPSDAPEDCQYLNVAVYLHDVGPDDAPTEVIPGSHRHAARLATRAHDLGLSEADGSLGDLAGLDLDRRTTFAVATAGTVVVYSSLLLHRARRVRDPRSRRMLFAISVGARGRGAFCRNENLFSYEVRDALRPVLTWTTPRVRTLLGWPPPGDAYYGARTLELLARMFPGIDLAPYRTPANGRD